jgi:hypothetical protein
MSGDQVATLAFLGSAAVFGLIWLLGRRADVRNRERYDTVQRYLASRAAAEAEAVPLSPAEAPAAICEALKEVLGDLKKAQGLLDEVSTIGVWSKSDGCGDNREKRQKMRETDWAVSGAHRALKQLRPRLQEFPEPIDALERDLASLVAVIEPLPETILDTMLDTPALDSAIYGISPEIARLSERASQLAAEYRQRIPSEQVEPS